MIVTTIQNLLTLDDNEQVEATKGTLRAIAKRFNTGSGDKASTMQFAQLTADGATIKLVLYGRPELPLDFNGRELFVTNAGAKCLKRRNYAKKDANGKDVIEPQLWCYSGADIAAEEADPAQPEKRTETPAKATEPAADSFDAPPSQKPASEPQEAAAPRREDHTPNTDEIKKTKQRAMQLGNLYSICMKAAAVSHTITKDDAAFPATQISNVATSIFIQMTREGFHTQMPILPIK